MRLRSGAGGLVRCAAARRIKDSAVLSTLARRSAPVRPHELLCCSGRRSSPQSREQPIVVRGERLLEGGGFTLLVREDIVHPLAHRDSLSPRVAAEGEPQQSVQRHWPAARDTPDLLVGPPGTRKPPQSSEIGSTNTLTGEGTPRERGRSRSSLLDGGRPLWGVLVDIPYSSKRRKMLGASRTHSYCSAKSSFWFERGGGCWPIETLCCLFIVSSEQASRERGQTNKITRRSKKGISSDNSQSER
eukprot:scaffold15577_cov35-Tisochrysis_lutea.AAC.1